jgi:DNA-binding GntR family transcriptional regulator
MEQSNSSLPQLNNKPLREQVLDALRDAIVQGEFKPGQTIVESELATQMGVSRAPIREALQILNTEGLLETVPYHGTTVRRLTKNDIEELYSLRSVLEVFAIRRVIAHDHPADVDILRKHYEDMLATADQGDLKKVNEIDRRFHDDLIELSRHQMLKSVWNAVALRVRQVMALLNERNTDIKQIAYNHLPIIDAIANRDEELAVSLIQQHVAATGELIAEGWEESEESNTE